MKKINSCFIGIDIGTTNIKIAAIEPNGNLLSLYRGNTPITRLSKGWAEHEPKQIWSVVTKGIQSIIINLPDTYKVEGVAVSSMGEAGTLIDANGNSLFPIIAWFDPRSVEQAKWWEREIGSEIVYSITGMTIDPKMGANKLLWLKNNYPEIFKEGRYWLSVADLIVYWLSGSISTDQSLASRTMLFDQKQRSWSVQLLNAAKIDINILPPAYVSGNRVGVVSSYSSKLTGLSEGTPVVLGGHDHLCGAYIARQGREIPVDATGTAEVVIIPSVQYKPETYKSHSYITCYADVVPANYVYCSPVGYAGALVEWFRQKIHNYGGEYLGDETIPKYNELIKLIPKPLDCSGIVCYPAFGRVIGPNWNPDASTGVFIGLTLDHHSGHILQALLEGTSYSLRENIEAVENITGRKFDRIIVEGGAIKNQIWMQLKADISGRTIESIWHEETVVLGTAVLAGVGVGYYKNHVQAAQSVILKTEKLHRDQTRFTKYDSLYKDVYLKLPDAISPFNRYIRKI